MIATTAPRCRCAHPIDTHEHYRRGTDCGACDCPRYQSRTSLRARAARLFVRAAGRALR